MSSRPRLLPLDVTELLDRCAGVVDIATAARAGVDEGEREWRLRRLGLEVVRFGWDR